MLAVAVLSLPFLGILAFRPLMRRIAVRNALRRPREALLVVLGSLLGTAIVTGSLVVGDTLAASIRASAHTQLGPVDEVVTAVGLDAGARVRDRLAGLESPALDGVLPMTAVPAAVAGPARREAEPRAQLLELDFGKARRFGDDAGATGIVGPTPRRGHAVVTDDLATEVGAGPGDVIEVFAYGGSRRLAVDRVLEQRGVAGLRLDEGPDSPNVFAAPGTIEGLYASAGEGSAEPPRALVAVSNAGGVEDGAARTGEAVRLLNARLDPLRREGVPANVVTVKQDLLDAADETGRSLTELFTSMGAFAVAAGVLLLVNIFVMLAEERKSELGMLRAVGLRRASLVGAFATEGWIYALLSSVVGTFVGLGLGRVITGIAARIEAGGDEGFAVDFTADQSSLEIGLAVGFAIALATVVLTSVRVSRFNIIQAIRDLDLPAPRLPRRRARYAGLALAALGAAVTAGAFPSKSAAGVIVGPMLVLAGIGPTLARWFPKGAVATGVSAVVILWGIVALPVAVLIDAPFEIFVFVVQGLTLAAAAVVLVSHNQGAVGRLVGRAARGSLGVRLGLAYPLARRFRTAMTVGMFSIVMFTLVYVSILSHIFLGQIDSFTRDLSGGFDVVVASNPSNPIALDSLRNEPGVRAVAPLVTLPADIRRADRSETQNWGMTAFDERLVQGGAPRLRDRGRYASDDAAWRAVLDDPGLAMVDEFFLSEDEGPPQGALDIGDRFDVIDPATGRARTVEVAALAPDDWIENGGWFGFDAAREVFGERAVPSRAYVAVDDPEAFADAVEAQFLAQGAESDTIAAIVDEGLTQQNQFFQLMRGYLALGLVVGIAGLAVVMVRAVRDRRREIGVLRALGFEAAAVRRAFVVESTFVAAEGVLIGLALALVTSYGLATTSDAFGDNFRWRVPFVGLVVIVVGTVVCSLLATYGPARAAARVRPAVALRMAG